MRGTSSDNTGDFASNYDVRLLWGERILNKGTMGWSFPFSAFYFGRLYLLSWLPAQGENKGCIWSQGLCSCTSCESFTGAKAAQSSPQEQGVHAGFLPSTFQFILFNN